MFLCQVRTVMRNSDDCLPKPTFHSFHILTDSEVDSDAKLYCLKHSFCFYLQFKFIMKKKTQTTPWSYIEYWWEIFPNIAILGNGHLKSEGCSEGEDAIISNSDLFALAPEQSRLLWFTWKWTADFRPC